MELALYAPGLGYYVAGSTKLGGDGDFVTAPEISPLFGRTLARQIAQVLESSGGEVLELGAGSGAMAADILGELQRTGCLPARYLILETSPQLVERQRLALRQKLPALTARIEWIGMLPQNFDGIIVANEVLDALPVHVVAWREEGVFERGVGWKDGLVWSERLLPPGPLRDAAAATGVGAGYVSEISLVAPALVRSLSAALRKGALLLIDYGFGRREYYHPQRASGTLMCHYRHRAHGDPLFLPGLQDLTAHVDFTAIAEAGIDAGMKLLGYTTQAQFPRQQRHHRAAGTARGRHGNRKDQSQCGRPETAVSRRDGRTVQSHGARPRHRRPVDRVCFRRQVAPSLDGGPHRLTRRSAKTGPRGSWIFVRTPARIHRFPRNIALPLLLPFLRVPSCPSC